MHLVPSWIFLGRWLGRSLYCMLTRCGSASCLVVLPVFLSSSITRLTRHTPGFFSKTDGSIGCLTCDDLGDFFQVKSGASACTACAQNTQRYVGVLSGANGSACQCKPGECRSHANTEPSAGQRGHGCLPLLQTIGDMTGSSAKPAFPAPRGVLVRYASCGVLSAFFVAAHERLSAPGRDDRRCLFR